MTPQGELDREALGAWTTELVEAVRQRLEQTEAQQQGLPQEQEPPQR